MVWPPCCEYFPQCLRVGCIIDLFPPFAKGKFSALEEAFRLTPTDDDVEVNGIGVNLSHPQRAEDTEMSSFFSCKWNDTGGNMWYSIHGNKNEVFRKGIASR
jgi:hypothetical protein